MTKAEKILVIYLVLMIPLYLILEKPKFKPLFVKKSDSLETHVKVLTLEGWRETLKRDSINYH